MIGLSSPHHENFKSLRPNAVQPSRARFSVSKPVDNSRPQKTLKSGLWVTVERSPALVGGLGQVSRSIPAALNRYKDKDLRILMPLLAPLKAEGDFEETGISHTLIDSNNHFESFRLLQKYEADQKTWVYATANDNYFGAHNNLYFPFGTVDEKMGDDPIFKSIMMFNRVAPIFARHLNSNKMLNPGMTLKQFEKPMEFVIVNDWLTSPFLSEMNNQDAKDVKKFFILHNTYNEPRYLETAFAQRLKIPKWIEDQVEDRKIYSPLTIGIAMADGVFANLNYVHTIVETAFAKGRTFVSVLEKKYKQNKVFDIHHGLDEDFTPMSHEALKKDGFTVLLEPEASVSIQEIQRFKQHNKLAVQKSLGLEKNPDAILLTWIARFEPFQKGFHLLMQGAKDFLEKHTKAQLVIAGTGSGPDAEIDAFVQSLNDNPAFKGRLYLPNKLLPTRDVVRMNAGADFLILPSVYEPFGLSQLEAMKMGSIPIVHGVDGLHSTVFDPQIDQEMVSQTGQTGIKMRPFDSAIYRKMMRQKMPNTNQEVLSDSNLPAEEVLSDSQIEEVLSDSQAKFRNALDRAMALTEDSDPEKLLRIRQNGMHYVHKEHAWSKIVERYERAFIALADEPQEANDATAADYRQWMHKKKRDRDKLTASPADMFYRAQKKPRNLKMLLA